MLESTVLEHVLSRTVPDDPRVLIGPGDDLAELLVAPPSDSGMPVHEHARVLVGVDQVVDGLHVRADLVPWDAIGRKAVNRSLSDIAAMAGRPLAVVAAVTFPQDTASQQVESLCEGIAGAAQEAAAPLVGGDVSIHHRPEAPLTISVTALGVPTARGVVGRQGARAGDLLVVTGTIGGTHGPGGTGKHLEFRPRLSEAVLLHALMSDALHAMIDISDGLGRDGAHLARGGGARGGGGMALQAVIDGRMVPCPEGIGVEQAIGEGEDHELLMAVDPSVTIPEAIGSPDAPCPITVVGRLREQPEGDPRLAVLDGPDGEQDVTQAGWDHGT